MGRIKGEQQKYQDNGGENENDQSGRKSVSVAADMKSQKLAQSQRGQQNQNIHPEKFHAEGRSVKVIKRRHGNQSGQERAQSACVPSVFINIIFSAVKSVIQKPPENYGPDHHFGMFPDAFVDRGK